MAALAARVGIADDGTSCVYDDTQGLFAARAWWSLRAYGLESVRVLDGGFPAWVSEGRQVSNAQVRAATAVRVRGTEPDAAVRTADVRGLLGSPDVTLLDAEPRPRYRGFEGNTKRLGHIPGAVNVPVGGDERAGWPAAPRRAPSCATVHRANVSRGRRIGLLRRLGGRPRRSSRSCRPCWVTRTSRSTTAAGPSWGNRLDPPVDR